MVSGAVPAIVQDFGVWCGVILSFLGVCAALSRTRGARWLWRHIVSQPVGKWITGMVEAVVEDKVAPIRAELSFNGGGTVKDKVTDTAAAVAQIMPVVEEWLATHPEMRPDGGDDGTA